MNKYWLLGGAAAAAGLTFALRRTKAQINSSSANSFDTNHTSASLDDAGTTNEMAIQIIRTIRDDAFDGSDEKLAIALGRPANEIQSWFDGSLAVGSDALIKARGLAQQRQVEIPRDPLAVGS